MFLCSIFLGSWGWDDPISGYYDSSSPDGSASSATAKNIVSERNRRKKLNERLFALRAVVPNISKVYYRYQWTNHHKKKKPHANYQLCRVSQLSAVGQPHEFVFFFSQSILCAKFSDRLHFFRATLISLPRIMFCPHLSDRHRGKY